VPLRQRRPRDALHESLAGSVARPLFHDHPAVDDAADEIQP
jgi:hypothetical protein